MRQAKSLRDRKKAQTRERIANVAAGLFAERGYEAVSVKDVADAAEVSDQTVYNYFPAKQDLVLDRVDEFLELYRKAIVDAGTDVSPADAVHALVIEDIERYRRADPLLARGEFPAQCVESAVLRRFSLEFRQRQIVTVSESIVDAHPSIEPIVATAHAASLISVVQTITDSIGASILAGRPSTVAANEMIRYASIGFDYLARTFTETTLDKGGAPE